MKSIKMMLFLFFITALASSAFAQRRGMAAPQRHNMFGRDLFAYRYYNFADTTDERKSRMEFHVGVVNDLLTFIKSDKGIYKARYEVAVVIYDKKKEPIVEKSVSGRVTAHTFAETNSRTNPMRHSISVSLRPGRYKGLLQLTDLETDESLTKELELTFRDFRRDKVHLSDIMFIDKIDTTDSGVVYTPNLSHVFDNVNSAFAAYIELYPPATGKDVEAQLSIFDAKGKKLYTTGKKYPSGLYTVSEVIPFREHLAKPGEYFFVVGVKSGRQTAKIQRRFSVIWGNMPLAKDNLDVAIEQLALVAHKKDIEAMRKADEEERKRLFDQFWAQRDPTPQTQKNELKEEFFRRVDFANRNFTEIASGRSGWQTDRGRIYIVYGPPDQVNHSDAEINMPSTEIWFYDRLGRKYFFADRTGDGVYRLVKVE